MKYLVQFGVSAFAVLLWAYLSDDNSVRSFQANLKKHPPLEQKTTLPASKSLDSVLYPPPSELQVLPVDTPYKPTRFPYYRPQDRYSDLFSTGNPNPTLLYNYPDLNTNYEMIADSASYRYRISEKIGDLDFRSPVILNQDDYSNIIFEQDKNRTWRELAEGDNAESATSSGRRLIPKIPVESKFFNRIFGGDYVEFRPTGFVNLDFALQRQRVANPSLPIRQQRNTNFLFDPHANVTLTGKVGEKMEISGSFDTKASFQFENNFKLEYTGFEEDIIQKIEFGNVSFPLSTSLISGGQNLFGVATELKFGRLSVRSVFSNQRARAETVNLQGGAQRRKFEIRGSDYEDNRHFFMGQYFRNNYETWLSTLPQITSPVTITRVEVYVTNRVNNTQDLRNIVAHLDLGEADPFSDNITPTAGAGVFPDNNVNDLLSQIDTTLQADQAVNQLEQQGFVNGDDFVLVRSARRLSEREFTFHPNLGYVSLLTPLRNDEVLAVAYEYQIGNEVFRVGELTEDLSERDANEVLQLKMLRPNAVRIELPTWDLMMKNVYSLNANQVSQQNFLLRIIYKDDLTGIDNPTLQEGENTQDVQLLQLLGLDNLNQLNDPQPDGNFDYLEGITIDSRNGRIFFPVLEPFGDFLRQQFNPVTEQDLINKFVFDTLYSSTKADAIQIATLDKFFLSGSFEASASSDVSLPGINIAPGSVRVTAGNTPLVEDQQYIVDYSTGRVTITDQSVLNSGKEIKIDYEKADLFNFQTRRLLGSRFDYTVNEDFVIGATIMNLSERPVITRVNIADEPVNNTMVGADVNYRSTSRLLTRLVDKIPLIQTKQESNLSLYGEYAQLFPGAAPLSGQVSFIDDFEGTRTAFNLVRAPQENWSLGATPQLIPGANSRELDYAYRRAKLAWYNVDNIFYRDGGPSVPSGIDDGNNYTRSVSPQEIFPARNQLPFQTNEIIFDVAYYPEERGPYNYNPNITAQGLLPNPEQNFGAITRAITSDIDFDNANVEYVEFWLMDPFIEGEDGRVLDGRLNQNNTTGGTLYLNLGNISEDVIPDGKHGFENGLPAEGATAENADSTVWGFVTQQQFITNAFDNDDNARENQDIGLDGLRETDEANFPSFQAFVNAVNSRVTDPVVREQILADLSADDFRYYLGSEFDADGAQILERYKQFNGLEGNSPVSTGGGFATAATNVPDNEDLNIDNTVGDLESYYQYRIPLQPGQLQRGGGNGYIVDVNPGENGATWYLFRIPVREFDNRIGNIEGFKSIRYLRMFMTDFREPVVLRFAQFQIVANQWRRFLGDLNDPGFGLPTEPYDANFVVSTVNIEENGAAGEGFTPYVLPPGAIRDRDVTTINDRQLNEQSMQLQVTDLINGDARAVFRNYNLDLLSYKRLRMYIHAESEDAEDGEMTAFVRLGTDFTDNYYEVEVPLTMTPVGALDPTVIWPEENEINIAFRDLTDTKVERNRQGLNVTVPFRRFVGRYRVTVVGNPDLSAVQVSMIGMRNPDLREFAAQDPSLPDQEDNAPKSVLMWVNELRITEFDQTAGWAALARANIQLADFAQVTGSIRYSTFGFGAINQKISERARETTLEYDIATTVALDKFFPESFGLKIPMFFSYEKRRVTPRFDPLDPDVELQATLDGFADSEERNEYEDLVIEKTTRTSLNFTNVQKTRTRPDAKVQIWDIENFSLTYAYSIERSSNITTADFLSSSQRFSLAYNFNKDREFIEPFKNVGFLSSPYLKIIKDFNFNPLPNQFSVRGDLDRNFQRTLYRSSDLTTNGVEPIFQKRFLFNRTYTLGWNLSQGLSFSYNALVNAVIDEPPGEVTDQVRDVIWENLRDFGRMKNFTQQLAFNYRLPIDKIPLTDWVSSDATFSTNYTWTSGAVAFDEQGQRVLSQADTLGNTISNSRQIGVQVGFDLSKLYKKSKFLDEVLSPRPKSVNNNKQTNDSTDTKKLSESRLLRALLKPILMLKKTSVTYSINEATVFPGFTPVPRFFGMSDGFEAPTYGFALFGSQNPDIKRQAVENDWVAPSPFLSQFFTQTRTENLQITADLEPVKDLRIQLDFNVSRQINYQENFRFDSTLNQVTTQAPFRSGGYTISNIAFLTAFQGDDDENFSQVFQEFADNRFAIRDRLRAVNPNFNPGDTVDYAINSQDVLIPAFIAAYTGKGTDKVNLSPFPRIPLPNWDIQYNGLSKIEGLKDIFSNVSITHSYASTYSVSNYRSNNIYGEEFVNIDADERDYQPPSLANSQGNFAPIYVINQVTISERFSPLIGVNLRTKSNLTVRVDFNKERDLGLNLSNAQVAEVRSNSLVLSLGYTKANLKLPFRSRGETIVLKNDIDFRLDLTIRDTRTIQRQLPLQPDEEITNVVTAGNRNFQLRPSINYVVNQQLNLQVYFEQNVNTPQVSSSFRRVNTTAGVQLRYNLAQ